MASSFNAMMQHLQAQHTFSEIRTLAIAEFAETRRQTGDLPVYLRILAGLGAFLSAVFFMGFLFASGIMSFTDAASMSTWGLVFMVGGFVLYLNGRTDDASLLHSFLIQTSFCAMAVGKAGLIFGVATAFESRWSVTLAAMAVTVCIYPFYKLTLDRFLSSFAVLMSFFVNTLLEESSLIFNLCFALQVGLMFVVLTYGRIPRAYEPFGYALVMSVCVMIGFISSQPLADYNFVLPTNYFTQMILTVVLIASIIWAANTWRGEPVLMAMAGAIALNVLSAPGVFLSIILLVLGYARHDNYLLRAGALFMPVFLTLYYYNLELSLAAKSGILVGSGALLLAAGFYVRWRRWDQEH